VEGLGFQVSEYLNQLMAWLRLHDLAGTWADVSGFAIAIVGFAITIGAVIKSKNAALAAKDAAQAAKESIRLFDAIQDFSTAIAILEEIKRAQRGAGISETLPDRYAAIRKQLIMLKSSSVTLTDDHLAVIQNAIANLSTMENLIERALETKGPFPIAKYNTLISADIDKLVEVFMYLRSNQEAA
jgi:hypothetical protein